MERVNWKSALMYGRPETTLRLNRRRVPCRPLCSLLVSLAAGLPLSSCSDPDEAADADADADTDTDADTDADTGTATGVWGLEGIELNAVWGRSADEVYASGRDLDFRIAFLAFDGIRWRRLAVEIPDGNELNGLFAAGPSPGALWGVGRCADDPGLGLIARYDGAAWQAERCKGGILSSIWASPDGAVVFAVGSGYAGWELAPPDLLSRSEASAWISVELGVGPAGLADIWGASSDAVYAVGHVRSDDDSRWDSVIVRHDGAAWAAETHDLRGALEGVWGSGSDDVYAVGCLRDTEDGRAVIAHHDGAGWSDVAADGDFPGIWLEDVWGTAGDDVYAVGWSLPADTREGVILHFDGAAWREVHRLPDHELRAVWASGPDDVYAVGRGAGRAQILHSDGQAWVAMDLSGV